MTELKTIRELGIESISIHSKDRKTLKQYFGIPVWNWSKEDSKYMPTPSIKPENEPKCVVAYCKNCLGIVFIIKTKTKYISYICLAQSQSFGTWRISEKQALELIKMQMKMNLKPFQRAEINEEDMIKIQNLAVVKTLKESE